MTLPEFVDALMRYCALTGGSVSSWGRSPWHNYVVEGVTFSGHLFWLGADVRQWEHYTAKELERAQDFLAGFAPPHLQMVREGRANIAERLGLRVFFEGDHDHLQPLDWKAG